MYGLVLEGGGAKGAYQIGAYKALDELGIEIKGIAGTSIGALNGAMIVQDELERAYELWYNISPAKVFNIDEERFAELKSLDISHDNLFYFMKKAKEVWANRGLDITFLKKLLEQNINEEKLRNSSKDFGIITINLTEMKPMELFLEDIPLGKVNEYLIASAHLPAFKRERVDGKYFLDGGFYDNLPVNLLLRKGYKRFIAIRTGALGRTRKISSDGIEMTYIKPHEDLGLLLDFNRDNARKNLMLGYYDTLKEFYALKGTRYYLKPMHDETYFMDFLMQIGEERILNVGELFGITGVPYKRLLFEMLIPKLANLLQIPKEGNYEDVVIRLLEIVAQEYRVERFKIYSFEELVHSLAQKQALVNYKVPRQIPSVIKKFDFLAKAVKDDVVKEVIFELFCKSFVTDERPKLNS